MVRLFYSLRAFLLPLLLALFALALGDSAERASAFVLLVWYFLPERKGYPLLASIALLASVGIFIILNEEGSAFALPLAILPLLFASLIPEKNHESTRESPSLLPSFLTR